MSTLSRRRFLAMMAATAGAGVVAARCGGGNGGTEPGPSSTGTAGPVKTGGVYRFASTIPALTIDPHTDVTMGLLYIAQMYGFLCHQFQQPQGPPLVRFDHAESLENPDDLTYLFKMRQGIKFQNLPPVNGRALTSQDVVYSIQRLGSVDSTPFWKTGMSEISAPDASTVKVVLSKVYAYAMAELSGRTAIVPEEAVTQFGDLKTHAVGSGPFQLASLSPSESITMDRNPTYYVPDIPYIDGIESRTFANDSSIQTAFKAQQLDTYTAPTKVQADAVSGEHVNITKEGNLAIYMINLNEIKAPVLQDERVREALDRSLDRDAIIQKLCFGEGKWTGPVSWALEYWSLSQEEMRQKLGRDLNKSKQLLQSAGVSDLTLELKTQSQFADLAAIIKAQAAEAGITINIISQDLGTWVNDLFNQNFELMVGVGLPYGDEMLPLQFNHTYNWTRQANPVELPDPTVDAILEKMLVTPDIAERHDLALDVTRKILDRHGPFLYLYAPYTYTARWDYVHGYEGVPSTQAQFTYDIWLDK